ncbi:unnamed protein product [Colias eurytheme]|nr:unnamed protein product [Colias eurytheme]
MIPRIDDSKSEDSNDNQKFSYDAIKHVKWYEPILLNRPLKVLTTLLLLAVIIPLLLYQFYFIPSGDFQLSIGSCLIAETSRLPCGPGIVPENECHPECCYDPTTNFCFHRLPSRFSYLMDRPWSEYQVLYPRVSTVPYNSMNSLTNIRLSISEETATHLSITLYNARDALKVGRRLFNKNYSYTVSSPELNIVVRGPQGTIFDTMRGPLIASDGVWEITFKLTDAGMYGLGELPLKPGTTKIMYNNIKGYSSVPLIFAHINGSYHGLLIDTNAPTEIMIRRGNHIVVRSLTDFELKFHLFVGPTPKDVMKDSMKLMRGDKKLEYWMLGAHICGTAGKELSEFISTLTSNRVPFESHCGHRPIVLASNRCESIEEKNIQDVADGANVIRRTNRRFVPHLSPYIRYNENNNTLAIPACSILPEFQLFMYHEPHSFEMYKGKIGNDSVLYPAYDVATTHFLSRVWPHSIKFDGVVMENNWPLDNSNKSKHDPSPYLPYFNQNFREVLTHTPKWNITLLDRTKDYFFKHNAYGQESINAFREIIGNDTYTSASSHWMDGSVVVNRQNIDALWSILHKELVAAALGGISGHWLWSTPICGDTDEYFPTNQTDLCVKWYMAATYFPMIKIDSTSVPRDPTSVNGTYRNRMIKALNTRLSLLPYFYTVLQDGPLLRPMFYQFPESDYLREIDSQFAVGDDLLIVPNLQPFQSHVHITMPPGTWYELWGGEKITSIEGEVITMPTLESDFLTLIRGGSIILLQNDVGQTAEDTRVDSSFSLIIALDCNNSTNCSASGDLYLLPTISFHFEATQEKLYVTAIGNDFNPLCDWNNAIIRDDIKDIKIFGLDTQFNNFDTHRHIDDWIIFCDLEYDDVIEYDLI